MGERRPRAAKPGPTVILMAGLQGSGKTTPPGSSPAPARGARHGRGRGGLRRLPPAAVDQLIKVGQQAGAHVYEQGTGRDPVDIAEWALDQAKQDRRDALIVDTSGRLHIDEELMKELAEIKKRTKPHNVLLVVDAMTGQDAVNVAEQFAETAELRRRGPHAGRRRPRRRGAVGEGGHRQADPVRLDGREARRLRALPPRPDGAADPRHGRRDDARREGREADGRAPGGELERKIRKEQFTLDDFLQQMQQVRNMGPLGSLLKMMPGIGSQLGSLNVDEKELDRLEAIIRSMTPEERANPKIIDGSRAPDRARSGTSVQAVSQLVKQFGQMRKVMKQISRGKMPSLQQLAGGR